MMVEMRKKEKQITDPKKMNEIIARAEICHIAFNDKGYPYIVPMNFGHDGKYLYFHSAPEGRKIRLIKKDGRVAFEISIYKGPITKGPPCSWGFDFRSVMGIGKMTIITDPKEKARAVEMFVRHYSKKATKVLPQRMKKMVMLKLRIEEMTAKGSIPSKT